jgi:DNA-binding NarL/FixJ family response regulator
MNTPPLGIVLLADRHHGLTESLRGLLETIFASVVMVSDEGSLFKSVQQLQPAAVVVDASIFPEGGVQWPAWLGEISPRMLLGVLSVNDELAMRRALLAAGADCFVLKRDTPIKLLPAIELALQGISAGDSRVDEKEESALQREKKFINTTTATTSQS